MEDAAEHFFALAAGTRLDEYEIVAIIGQGSFGITYLAEDVNLGIRFAVKEYLPGDWAIRDSTKSVRPKSSSSRQSFEWGMDAFLKEARILAGISHPNIVKVRRFFRANGTAYIVMDFVEGRGFGDILAKDYPAGGYPPAALDALLQSLLDGLAAVHKAGVVHRDIKPANILIEANGNPILIDFGAARNFQRTIAGGMTVIMTPGYAPIEQYAEDEDQGPFTDMFSLGAVAYRAIAGRAPMEPYKRLSGGAFSSATQLGAGRYPGALLAAIDWAIAIQPKDRPQNAAAFRARLRGEDDDRTAIMPVPPRRSDPPVPPRDPPKPAPAKARRSPLAIGAAAAILLLLIGLGGFAYYRTTAREAESAARQQAAEQRLAADAARLEAEQQARAAAQAAEERRAAAAAQEAAQRAAAEAAQRAAEDAARREAERKAAEAAARQEAEARAAEAARLEAEQRATEAARQEAERRAAQAARDEAARKAAQAAREEAAVKAAEAAKQQAARRAASQEAARRPAEAPTQPAVSKSAARDGRWYADLPRNNCGAVRVQAIAMGDVVFGSLGMPQLGRSFRADIAPDGTFSSSGPFDKVSGRFGESGLELTAVNSCSHWTGNAQRTAFTLAMAPKGEIVAAFEGRTARFANGESSYAADGSYTRNDRNGITKGKYAITDGTICVTFESGVVLCDAIFKSADGFLAVGSEGYSYPIAFK